MTTSHGPELHEDRAWLDAFRVGDRGALERVFRRYAPLVMRVLRGGTRSKDGGSYAPGIEPAHEVEDVLHDVFLEAFRPEARLRYDGLRPYGPFLAQMARHRLFDVARARGRMEKRQDLTGPRAEEIAAASEEPTPDEVALAREEGEMVRAFKRTLAPEELELVHIRYSEGRSQGDAAGALGISRQQIRTREKKIRERFQLFIDRWQPRATSGGDANGGHI